MAKRGSKTSSSGKAAASKVKPSASVTKLEDQKAPAGFDLAALAAGVRDAAGEAIGEAVAFVERFSSDRAFRESMLFGAVEVAEQVAEVLAALAGVSGNPTAVRMAERARILSRGAEDFRRRMQSN
jgi:hypothetical protein